MGTPYYCKSQNRRQAVRAARRGGVSFINGIDFLEVASADQKTLAVTFLHNLPGAPTLPVPASPDLTATNVVIIGGVRIKPIRVLSASRTADNVLTVTVDTAGDFSLYTLRLVTATGNPAPPPGFDPRLSDVAFSFKVECPDDFDCKTSPVCPPEPLTAPPINYLAKDYNSFRQLMLDRLALLVPDWTERSAADLGITLVELLAYVADYLSYRQDAVATEAYLGTARRRTSVRRHARLVDYFMHDGCNARAWVRVEVSADILALDASHPAIPRRTKLLTPLPAPDTAPAALAPDPAVHTRALAAGVPFFETMYDVFDLFAAHNRIDFHTWGETQCCLPRGATSATLRGTLTHLKAGDVLIFTEVFNPTTGGESDADPSHRYPVRLTGVQPLDASNAPLIDPLTGDPITEITWAADDALPSPVCISSQTDAEHGGILVDGITVAMGNVVLADHGRTLSDSANPTLPAVETLAPVPVPFLTRTRAVLKAADLTVAPSPARSGGLTPDTSLTEKIPPRYRPRLKQSPLTQSAPPPYGSHDATVLAAAAATRWSMDDVLPALTLTSTAGGTVTIWSTARDLLGSRETDSDYVVEVDVDDGATLRFGDGINGRRPTSDLTFQAAYRVGNGTSGNIAAGAISHLLLDLPGIRLVTNPLPAVGGTDPEAIEHVRQSAPYAFRTQERAVTLADYGEVARRFPGVQRGVASLRWTGSWNTVFLSVDRHCGCDVDDPFKAELRGFLEPFRMAGQDLAIDAPVFVPLEITLHVCVKEGYFRGEVKASLLEVFSNGTLPDGRLGVFNPANFTFGQSVYLSRIIAAAQGVEGVLDVRVIKARRQGKPGTDATGVLKIDRLEVARLDNDPNFPDRGILVLELEGGK